MLKNHALQHVEADFNRMEPKGRSALADKITIARGKMQGQILS